MGRRALTVLAALAVAGPACAQADQPLPINLPTALQLAQVRNLDVQIAAERVAAAVAQLDRARSRWLPTIVFGAAVFEHDATTAWSKIANDGKAYGLRR